MKIIGTQTAEFEISPEEQKKVCLEYIYRNFDWGNGFYISKETQKVCRKVNLNITDFVRNASPLDYSVEAIVSKIKIYSPK